MNKSISKLKHQGLRPNEATFIVEDSIVNYVIEVKINKKNKSIKVRNFSEAIPADMERKRPTLFYTSGEMILRIYICEQS